MTLNRDQILEANDLTSEPVEVPEWAGSVLVRTMSGAARDAFDLSLNPVGPDGTRTSDLSNMRVKLVAMTAVDEAGNLLFSMADVAALGRKSSAAIERVYQVAQRLNWIGPKAAAIAEKNSASDQSFDSGIASLATSENPSESASAT